MLSLLCGSWLPAASATPSLADVRSLIEPAQRWLVAQQDANGGYAGGSVGLTSLITEALLDGAGGLPFDDPAVVNAVEFLLAHQQPDGGIYSPAEGAANYATALSLMILARLPNPDQAVIERAQQFLLGIQNLDENDINFGGIGYGSGGKGQEDLSNTGFAIEALRQSGIPADHPGLQRA